MHRSLLSLAAAIGFAVLCAAMLELSRSFSGGVVILGLEQSYA